MASDFLKKKAQEQRERMVNGGSSGTVKASSFLQERAAKQREELEKQQKRNRAARGALEAIGDRAVLDFIEKASKPQMVTPVEEKQKNNAQAFPQLPTFGNNVQNTLQQNANKMPLAMQGERSAEVKWQKAVMDADAAEEKLLSMEPEVQRVEAMGQQITQKGARLEQTYANILQLKSEYESSGDYVTGQAYLIAVEQYNKDLEAYQKEFADYEKSAKVFETYNKTLGDLQKKYLDRDAAYQAWQTEQEKDRGEFEGTGGFGSEKELEKQKGNVLKAFYDQIGAGAGQFNKAIAQTVKLVAEAPMEVEELLFGSRAFTASLLEPVLKWANWVVETADAVKAQAHQEAARYGTAGELAGMLTQGTVAALPSSLLAILSGGVSAAGQIPAQTTGLVETARQAVLQMAQNPMYWSSVLQTLGSSYEEALSGGATEGEALVAAVLNSLAGSAIEVGGGMEQLPEALRDADLSNGKRAWQWLKSGLEEGGEELVQNPLQRLINKVLTGSDVPLFSMTDQNTVINPATSAQEFAGGAAVGLILGGGTTLADVLLNGRNDQTIETAKTAEEALENLQTAYQQLKTTGSEVDAAKVIEASRVLQEFAKATDNGTATRKEVNDYVQQQDLKRAESSGGNSEWGASLDAEESNGNQPAAGAKGSGTVGESEIDGYVENLRQQGRLRNASTASLNVDGGIETDDVGVIGIEDETTEMREIRERGENMGVDTIFVTSAMTVESGGRNYRITGEHKGDRIIVQVNNKRMSMDQAAAHEMYHVLADKDPELVQRTRETLQTRYSQEQLNAMYQKYEAVYSDVYSRQEGMTDERVAQRIYEEMLADAYAEYGRFADQNTGLLTETVREAARPVEEMAKSDVAAAQRELDTAVKKKTAADVETTTEQRMFQSMALDETIRGLVADRNDGVITQEEYQQKLAEYADKAYGNEASDTRVIEDQSRFALDEEADEQIVAEESESQEETKSIEKEPLLLEVPAEEEVTDGDSLTEAIQRAAGGYESFMVAQPKKVQELWNRKISNAAKVLAKGMWTDPNEEFIAAAQEMAQAYMEQGTISTQMENDWFKSLYKLAPEHKGGMKAAKREYQANVRMMMSEFNEVRRYIKAKLDSEQTQEQEEPQAAELERLWQRAKQQRRAYERAAARNLLTEEDRIILGMLLKGETSIWKINPKKHNRRGIIEVYEAKQAYEDTMRRIRVYKLAHIQEMQDLADSVLMMLEKWKDKKSGLRYSKSTMERNIRDIAPNQEIADKVIEAYFQPVHKNEAKAIKLINRMRKRVKGLKLSNKESMAVQLMGEATSNVETLKDKPADTKRDGKTLEEWRQEIIKLKEDNPKLDWNKIDHTVAEFRDIYDELFQMQNEARVRNGYEPISYRKGYFPHFNNVTPDGILAAFGQAFGVSSEVTALPTTINGLTKNFKPGIRWTGHALERVTGETTLDAVEGFDRYIEAAADVIYHTDDIQRLRALANRIRYKASDQGLRDQIDEIKIRNISQAEKDSAIKQLYDDYGKHGRYSLSNFVVELEEYTNILANKKSEGDRITERKLGRSFYNASKAFEGRIAANMVAVNPASWLTNFIPITQAWGAVRTDYMIAGLGKTVWNDMKQLFKMDTDGIVDRSAFLTNRRGTERLAQNWTDKASKAMTSPMAMVDALVSDTIVRARYLQNLKQGLSEDAALDEADAFAAAVIADRSKGALPTIFNEKNAVTKLLTTFQVEQINQFEYYFKDLPREARKRHAIFVVYMLAKVMLGAWWYNELYEKLVGRRPAFDPVGMVQSIFEDIAEGKDIAEVIMGAGGDALEQVPFVGGLMGGGRIPISSALPDIEQLIKAAAQPVDDPDTEELEGVRREEKLGDVFKELLPTIAYTLPPFGGGQVKKVIETLEAVKNHGSYSRSGELQYPVFVDDPKDLRVTLTTGLILGKSSLDEAVEWVDSDFKNLSERYTEAYVTLIELGENDRKAYEVVKAVSDAKKTETESESVVKRQVLQEMDVDEETKLTVYYSVLASDREQELIYKLGEEDAEAVYSLMNAMYGAKTSEKREMIKASGLSEAGKEAAWLWTKGSSEDSQLTADERLQLAKKYDLYIGEVIDAENIGANFDTLEKLGLAGLSSDTAYTMTMALREAEIANGEDENLDDLDRFDVILANAGTERERLIAIETMTARKDLERMVIAKDYLSTDQYQSFLRAFQKAYPGEKVNQERAEEVLNDMSLTNKERAILWQIATNGKDGKKNPFDDVLGKKIYDLVNQDEDDSGIDWAGRK